MATPVLFKDFNKTAKDLLTKNYQTSWKLESKYKAADQALTVNPVADKDGVAVNIEYADKAAGVKGKFNVKEDLSVKPTVTYEKSGHKVELTITAPKVDTDFELTYEGQCPMTGSGLYMKATKGSVTDSISYNVTSDVTLGAGAAFDFKSKTLKDWSLGARYLVPACKCVVSFTTSRLTTFNFSAVGPVPVEVRGKKMIAALSADFDKSFSDPVVTAGVEVPCPLLSFSTLKAKVNNKMQATVSFLLATGSWKTAISADVASKPKVGVLITCE